MAKAEVQWPGCTPWQPQRSASGAELGSLRLEAAPEGFSVVGGSVRQQTEPSPGKPEELPWLSEHSIYLSFIFIFVLTITEFLTALAPCFPAG